ncbi:hypothetical protein [Peterkaempfera sp. SMS 1(5)a]|uniref:hypothetical protein n=1 Tax=Peterkaempfera podocarpi TaxID=3232308 RepID=UPI00366DDC84
MKTADRTVIESTHRTPVPVRRAFDRTRMLVAAYGALSTAVLVTVVIRAIAGQEVTSFMWGRSAGVLVSAAASYWLTGLAARGARWAYVRVRIISIVMPFVIIGIDTIPGLLPAWFIVMQAICAAALAAAAFVVNGPRLRAAFPKAR